MGQDLIGARTMDMDHGAPNIQTELGTAEVGGPLTQRVRKITHVGKKRDQGLRPEN